MRLFGCVAVLSIGVLASQSKPDPVLTFVQSVRALPPEFSADLLLRIAAARTAKEETAWKMERIEEAFELGGRSPDPFPSKGSLDTDSRSAVTAATHGLDALSLRLRAVEAMLPLDPGRAAGMFREIGVPVPPVSTCQSAHLPDWERYYSTLQRVYVSGFTAKERERGEPGELLRAAIAGAHSPLQVPPLGRLLLSPAVQIQDRQLFFDSFADALAGVEQSDREFAPTEGALLQLTTGARRLGLTDAAMLRGLSSYLALQGSGPRCTPSWKRLKRTADGWQWPLALEFNKRAAAATEQGQSVSQISGVKMTPEKDAGQWDDGEFWRSARAKAVLADLRWLTHGNRDLPADKRFWTIEERSTAEWNTRCQELLRRLEGWKPDEESGPRDYFWMRNHALQAVAALTPPGPARDLAVRRWMTSIEQWYQPGTVQNDWFGALQYAMRSVRAELAASSNPVAAAYAQWAALSRQ
ncbi:MAG TPA: hypothetical protein VFQ91_25465 [Bryobacteraceae bacterium]|nr:hypothetical protein [Bryobacteraceae bacterium]